MPPSTTPFSALQHRNFRLFITGQFVSLCGTWMQGIALGWLVLELTDSVFAVGLVSAMGALPVLLFTLHGGALADRWNRRRALILLQSGMLLEALVLAIIAWTGHATLGWIIALALVAGTLSAYEIPVRQSFLMDLVGKDNLMNGIAMNSLAFNLSRVFGPALAGVIVAVAGAPVAFFINAASYLAVLGGLLQIRLDPALISPRRVPPPLGEALRYIFAPGWPRTLVTMTATYTIFGISFLAILPAYARDVLGTGATGYGGLTSAFGLGAAAGGLAIAGFGARLRRGDVALKGGLLIGIALLLAALAPVYTAAFLLLLIGGMSAAMAAIVTNTLLQTQAPDPLRGRVIGFYSFIVVGLAPFGSFQAGWIGEHLGIRTAAATGGGVCLLVATWLSLKARAFATPLAEERRQASDPSHPYRWGERRHS
jgi:MFS family permease